MKIKNIYLALKDQFPLKKFYNNFFVTGNGRGLFSINSHINKQTRQPKVMYDSRITAQKAAESLSKKYGKSVTAYKCMFCDGYHIGNDRNSTSEGKKR